MRPSAARRLAADVAALQLAGRDVVVADYPLLNPLLRRHGVPEEALWQCTAGRARLAVQADGVVSPCHPFRHPLGDLKTEPIAGFIARALATASARRLAARDHDDCRSCDHRAVCGSCQALSVARGAPFGGNAGACRPVVFGEAERSGEAATNGQT
jgi:radical SAM protein with 4Fe4S-binding SPASM domain